MPKLDLTISISVILAVCAIISPIATAIINNKHQINLKKLEYAHKVAETSLFYKRGIYEDYLRCVGKCFSSRTQEALQEYGKTYALALIYFPASLIPTVLAKHTHKTYITYNVFSGWSFFIFRQPIMPIAYSNNRITHKLIILSPPPFCLTILSSSCMIYIDIA